MPFDVSLYTILGPPPHPQTSSFACYMRPHSGPLLSFLSYYMGASSDQFFHLLWRPPYVFFSYYMGAPRIISLHTILGPPDHFLRLLYGAPQISFFSYNMGAHLRSVSLCTIWGTSQISFFACYRGDHLTFSFFFTKYMGAPSDQFLCLLYGVPSDQFLCILFGGPSQISFFSYCMGPLSDQFFLLLYRAPSDQFLRILYVLCKDYYSPVYMYNIHCISMSHGLVITQYAIHVL